MTSTHLEHIITQLRRENAELRTALEIREQRQPKPPPVPTSEPTLRPRPFALRQGNNVVLYGTARRTGRFGIFTEAAMKSVPPGSYTLDIGPGDLSLNVNLPHGLAQGDSMTLDLQEFA
jgi:hypothetical protein